MVLPNALLISLPIVSLSLVQKLARNPNRQRDSYLKIYMLSSRLRPLDEKRGLGREPGLRSRGLDGALGRRERRLDG